MYPMARFDKWPYQIDDYYVKPCHPFPLFWIKYPKTSFILEDKKCYIIEIQMRHLILLSIALFQTFLNKTCPSGISVYIV